MLASLTLHIWNLFASLTPCSWPFPRGRVPADSDAKFDCFTTNLLCITENVRVNRVIVSADLKVGDLQGHFLFWNMKTLAGGHKLNTEPLYLVARSAILKSLFCHNCHSFKHLWWKRYFFPQDESSVKSSLCEITLSHQSDYSLLDIYYFAKSTRFGDRCRGITRSLGHNLYHISV